MPELPELQALAEGLHAACIGRAVTGARAHHPATVRTVAPPLSALPGRTVTGVWRRGKIIGIDLSGGLTLAMHLMSAGRLGVLARGPGGRAGRQACLDLDIDGVGTLRLRELGTRRRATAHVLDADALARHRPLTRLGPEPVGLTAADWRAAFTPPPAARLHTALRDGRRVAGIGRAYASDIMWVARLAPFATAARLDAGQLERLAGAVDTVLGQALERARATITTALPSHAHRVTVAHGHHGEPCLRCAGPLARVGFADYELVYCPACQTGGRRYSDRRLDRLMR